MIPVDGLRMIQENYDKMIIQSGIELVCINRWEIDRNLWLQEGVNINKAQAYNAPSNNCK